MKRLKFQCLYGGKMYPLYAAMASFFVAPLMVGPAMQSFAAALVVMFIMPVITLIVCYFIEQHLTVAERAIVEETAYPLWMPAPFELLEAARNYKSKPSAFIFAAIVPLIGLELGCLLPERGDSNPTLAGFILLLFAGLCLLDWYLRGEWQHADSSTVYTKVDIHHMYDVEHHNKSNSWMESYLVFYQPDGRYVLHAPKGMGDVKSIYILKYRGMVIWLPAYDYSMNLSNLH
ncbi:MAG TPA: hypothetical protein DDX71_05355 [Ruminococcus sp.]|nr:hypothetical protein [Ruminococcus sp.]